MKENIDKKYNTVIRTKDSDERDNLIVKLYNEGKKYYYTDKQKDGNYVIAYNVE